MGKNILLTGSSGFIASAFRKKLESEGINVIPYDIRNGDDILDYSQLLKQLDKADSVWHFAAVADLNRSAVRPYESMEINIRGVYNIAQACHESHVQMNFISTCCVYGNCEEFPSTEKTLPNPSELYACSKMAGEYIVLGYHRQFDMDFNILRIPTTYGPGMRDELAIAKFIRNAHFNLPIEIHSDGEQTRTYTYIDDLIDALWLVEYKGIKNEILNVSSHEEISVNQAVDLIKLLTQSKSSIVWGQQRRGQTFKESISTKKLERLTGWYPKTSFAEGIKKCMTSF